MVGILNNVKTLIKKQYEKKGYKTSLPSNLENEKKYLQQLYTSGNEGQKVFAKRQANLYGLKLQEPTVTAAKSTSENPLTTTLKTTSELPSTFPESLKSAITDFQKKYIAQQPVTTTGQVVTTTTPSQAGTIGLPTTTSSQKSFQDLLAASKQKVLSNLDLTKQKALAQIGQQQSQLTPQYEALRSRAATQSMQQARNLAEYMAARGQTMSGLAAQSELSRGMGLTRQLGQIGQQQQIAQQDLANRKSMIEQDYLSKVANAQSDFELKQLEKAYTDAIKAEDRAYQEQKTAEERAYKLQQDTSKPEKYDYNTDPSFSDIYNQIVTGKELRYVNQQDVGLPERRRGFSITPEEMYNKIVADRITLVKTFGEDGYKVLLSTAKDKLPKQGLTLQNLVQ